MSAAARPAAPAGYVTPALLVAGAKGLGGVAMVAMNLWLARRLPPATFGVFAIATTALLMFDGVFGSAVDAAVIRTTALPAGEGATGTERAGVLLKLQAGAAAAAVGAGVFYVAGSGTAAVVAALAALGGTGLLVHRSVLLYLQLRERFPSYAGIDLAHTAARWVFAAIALAAGFASAGAVVGAYALAPWVVAAVAIAAGICLRARSSGAAAGEVTPAAGTAMRTVLRTAGWTLATTGVGAVVARLDLLLIGAVAGAREAGVFAAASALALVPTWLGAYLAPALSGRILPYCRERRMYRFLGEVQGVLLVLAAIGTTAGVLMAPALARVLLPAEYDAAGRVLAILLVAGAAGFVTFPLVLHTLLFLSPRTYLVIDLVSLPILIPLYVVAARSEGAVGVAWVTAGATVIKACIAQVAAAAVTRRADAGAIPLAAGA